MLTAADIARLQAYWLCIINWEQGARRAATVPAVPPTARQPEGVH